MKWYRVHRPKIHWWFWNVMIVLQLSMCLFFYWAGRKYDSISTGKETIILAVFSLHAFIMTRIWMHWIDNPKDYEALHQARNRRLSRRTRIGKRKEESKKKD